MKVNLICNKLIQFSVVLIHLVIFIYYFIEAIKMDAQYQLIWIPWAIVDFPITIVFFVLVFLNISFNAAALISFGVLGTFWWYWLSGILARKLCPNVHSTTEL